MYSIKASFCLLAATLAMQSAQAITTDECPKQLGNPFALNEANVNGVHRFVSYRE
jgi:hypothetical protein